MPSRKTPSLWDMWAAQWATARRIGETMHAANDVIGSRLGTISAAARNPIDGDYAELATMVTEKVEALARIGASLADDMLAIQAETIAAIGEIAVPGAQGVHRLTIRSARITDHMLGAAGRAFAPVHARATANARRLRRPPSRG